MKTDRHQHETLCGRSLTEGGAAKGLKFTAAGWYWCDTKWGVAVDQNAGRSSIAEGNDLPTYTLTLPCLTTDTYLCSC
jgi:hypothetical protein